MNFTELTNQELEQWIYEVETELIDSRLYKKLLDERKRRSLEEWKQ